MLVVVLIIGILSAIALPQYQAAVTKTRIMALVPIMTSINQAQKEFYLANGFYSSSFDNLSVQLPGNFTSEFVYGANQNQCYFATQSSIQCQAKGVRSAVTLEKYYDNAYYICWPGESIGVKVCQNLANKTQADSCTSGGCTGYRLYF